MSSKIDRSDFLWYFLGSELLYLLVGIMLGFIIGLVFCLFFLFLYSRYQRTNQLSYVQMNGEGMDIQKFQVLDRVPSLADELAESERELVELIWKNQPVNQSQLPELAKMSRSRICELISGLSAAEWIVRERIGRTYRIRLNTLKLPEKI